MAYRDELEAARARIGQLERELAECQARLAAAEAPEPSADQLSKRERQQRRRGREAQQRARRERRDRPISAAHSASWLGRAASPVGFLLALTPLLIGSCILLGVGLGLTALMTELGLAPPLSEDLYLTALFGVPALAGLTYLLSSGLVRFAAQRERRWARSLPFELGRYHTLFDAFMATDVRLRCRATTTSGARTPAIVDHAAALASDLTPDAEVSWHDGHLEIVLPLPLSSSAWRAARRARATVHALVSRVLIPLHATHPLEHITLHTRL